MNISEHSQKVVGLFGRIARWYDFLNHFLSLGVDIYWRYRLVRSMAVPSEGIVLDLAAGTLDVGREILRQHPGAKILALDFTLPMLLAGQKKLAKANTNELNSIFPLQADAREIPLPDKSVDCVSIAFGIRNILPRNHAYTEILRVLKPGGTLCILEFGSGKKKVWKGIYNFYLSRILPLVGKMVSKDTIAYTYLAETICNFPGPDELGREIVQAGFSRIFFYPLSSGIVYVHVAQKPGKPGN
jgi:demethylmenaquinone methyltransferase/2-methoxy-6-polyprenyl-1,4-benzoquinol methylase